MDVFKTIIIRSYFDTYYFDKMIEPLLFSTNRNTSEHVPNVPPSSDFTDPPHAIHVPRVSDKNNRFSEEVAKTFIRFFYFQPHQRMSVSKKYLCIHNVINNPFVSPEIQTNYLQHLCEVQHKYFVLLRFVMRCKWKYAKVQVSTDLYMNELAPTHRRTLQLFQYGRIYSFALSDLIKMVIHSITHSSYLFPLPIRAKNPYTHQDFTKSDLYNIYFKMRDTLYCIPHLIELYFRCDFDIYRFKKQHSTEIFQTIVKNYIDNLESSDSVQLFYEMIHYLHMERIISIDEDYPVQCLIKTMKPFLYLYMFCKYTCDKQLENNITHELCYRFHHFVNQNPLFGRKIYKSLPKYSIADSREAREPYVFIHAKQTYSYSSSESFLSSHIYNENNYNSYIYRGYYPSDQPPYLHSHPPQPPEEMDDGYQPVFSPIARTRSESRRLRRRVVSDSDELTVLTPSTPTATSHSSPSERSEPRIYFDDDDEESDEESVYECPPLIDTEESEEERNAEEEDYDW
jgi:hypothetical protein